MTGTAESQETTNLTDEPATDIIMLQKSSSKGSCKYDLYSELCFFMCILLGHLSLD